jgi:hypothetical protein
MGGVGGLTFTNGQTFYVPSTTQGSYQLGTVNADGSVTFAQNLTASDQLTEGVKVLSKGDIFNAMDDKGVVITHGEAADGGGARVLSETDIINKVSKDVGVDGIDAWKDPMNAAKLEKALKPYDIKLERGLELVGKQQQIVKTNEEIKNSQQNREIQKGQWELSKEQWAWQQDKEVWQGVIASTNEAVKATVSIWGMILQGRMIDLAETKEGNMYMLQKELIAQKGAIEEKLASNDLKKTKIDANTRVALAKIGADVKKTRIKSDSMKDLFYGQRKSYFYGVC